MKAISEAYLESDLLRLMQARVAVRAANKARDAADKVLKEAITEEDGAQDNLLKYMKNDGEVRNFLLSGTLVSVHRLNGGNALHISMTEIELPHMDVLRFKDTAPL